MHINLQDLTKEQREEQKANIKENRVIVDKDNFLSILFHLFDGYRFFIHEREANDAAY